MKVHNSWEGVNPEDVKAGEMVDMEAGCFLEKNIDGSWSQIDGGYALPVPLEDVIKWLKA